MYLFSRSNGNFLCIYLLPYFFFAKNYNKETVHYILFVFLFYKKKIFLQISKTKTGMAFLILLLSEMLIFISATAFVTDKIKTSETIPNFNNYHTPDDTIPERVVSNNDTNYRLSKHIIPEHYFIKIDLSNINHIRDYKFFFSGEISIDFRIVYPTKTIDFHVQRPYIKIHDYILFQRSNETSDISQYVTADLVEKSYNPLSHIFVLHFAEELLRGNYTLKMKFDRNADDGIKNFLQIFYLNEIGEKK